MVLDLLHLLRTLRRSPASAAAAILTLSLTLGAGASIFAIVDAVLLTPPPFADPASLVTIGETPLEGPAAAPRAVTYATFAAWRDRAGSMAALEADDSTNLTLTGLGRAERVSGSNVTPGFLALLGAAPARGRTFDAGDAGRPVVIVSDAFWRGTLAADPDAIGREIVLGGQPHTIVGILPERFTSTLSRTDIWRPLPAAAQAAAAGYRVGAIARLAPGVAAADLASALGDVSRGSSPPSRPVVRSVATAIAGDAAATLGLLAGAAALAMIIAFANLAGLLSVRAIDRRRELAVRTALGARQAQVVRLLLLEAQLIVVLGIVGGIVLAAWMTPALARLTLERLGAVANRDITVSWRVIAAIAATASVCAVMCAAMPAFVAARRSVVDVLRRGVTPQPRELFLRRVFVAGEVALAFVLVVSVTLLGRSLFTILKTDPGFDAGGVLAMNVALPPARYGGGERVVSFYSSLQDALEARLGPGAISIVDEIPLTGDRGRSVVSLARPVPGREAVVRSAAREYFGVMRIPLLAGRSFDSRDHAAAPPRVVISQSLAQSLFPAQPAVGRQVWFAAAGQMVEIIGVAGDVKHRALDEDRVPTVYLSALQTPSNGSVLVVRAARPDADVIAAVREEVARLDGDLPVYGGRPMRDVVASSPGVPARRVLTATFSGFAILALALGGIGLVGVAAHDVACRRGELALRIALGADPKRILGATLGQGLLLIGAGLAAGAVLSLWTTRALGAVVIANDRLAVASVAGSAVVLAIAGVCAVLPAARRAASTDPLGALRGE